MAGDPNADFLDGLAPAVRSTAERVIAIVTAQHPFDVAIKWRQLTFAVDNDFDHWICAVAATSRRARLVFHFGAWLDDPAGLFQPSEARFVRRIEFTSSGDVDELAVRALVRTALDELPRFRAMR